MKTISQLPNTDSLSDTDLFLCVNGGVTKNISWGQIKTLIEGKKSVRELRATNAIWMPSEIYVTNFYTTNLLVTWITNDFSQDEFSHSVNKAHQAIEVIATSIPKPIFTASQWGMILFGAIISIICITRILVALKLNK